MKKLRWGILGTGNIASKFAEGVRNSQRGQLLAVGSRSAASAATFGQSHQLTACHAGYDALLQDKSVDAVYVSLPNSMHHEWTLKSLSAGKHVLCEKPFATNLAQSQEMFDAARRAGRVLMEAFMYRSHPLTLAIQKAVAEGEIGELKIIRSSFLYHTNPATAAGNVRFNHALAGGALMDIGCYCVSYSRLFAGAEPTTVQAVGHLHESGVDDYAAGTLAFPGNILATFSCGMAVPADNTASLLGTKGYIEIPVPWKPPASNAAYTLVNLAGKRSTRTVNAGLDLYALEADDFATAALDGTPPRVSEQDTLGNMKTLDALRRQIGLHFST